MSDLIPSYYLTRTDIVHIKLRICQIIHFRMKL